MDEMRKRYGKGFARLAARYTGAALLLGSVYNLPGGLP